MRYPNYQTIPELKIKGLMDTSIEFKKIGLSKDLTGKKVLDVGCNEGAYVFECLKRKAKFVQAIDMDEQWVVRAEKVVKYYFNDYTKDYTQKEQSVGIAAIDAFTFLNLQQERFDLVLLLSLTHLNENPNQLIRLCLQSVKKGGLFILEIRDDLQKEKIHLPKEAKFFGKNKNNRSVWHIYKK